MSAASGHLPFTHGPQRQDGHNRRADGGHDRADQAARGFRCGATAVALQPDEPGTDQPTGKPAEQDRDERKDPSPRRRQGAERPLTIGFHAASVRNRLVTKGGE
jgi:hypothetical protein